MLRCTVDTITRLRGCCVAVEIENSPNGNGPEGAVPLIGVAQESGGKPLGGRMVMVLHPVLVAADLAVQLVHQLVDGRVQVFMCLLDEDVTAFDVQRDLGLLTTLLLS